MWAGVGGCNLFMGQCGLVWVEAQNDITIIETRDSSLKIGFFVKIWLILSSIFIKMFICMLNNQI